MWTTPRSCVSPFPYEPVHCGSATGMPTADGCADDGCAAKYRRTNDGALPSASLPAQCPAVMYVSGEIKVPEQIVCVSGYALIPTYGCALPSGVAPWRANADP